MKLYSFRKTSDWISWVEKDKIQGKIWKERAEHKEDQTDFLKKGRGFRNECRGWSVPKGRSRDKGMNSCFTELAEMAEGLLKKRDVPKSTFRYLHICNVEPLSFT